MSTLYDEIGASYRATRRAEPLIAALIDDALGDARSVVNVGAGTGAYEPTDREVLAIEPSQTMIAQRPPGVAPVVQASAEELPLPDKSFDAALAVNTVHHWQDVPRALAELRRLETGEVGEDEFAARFGPLVGIQETEGLVDRLFAGMRPDEAMIDAVRRARRAGVRTGLVSNSWGAGRYDRDSFPELFDGVVISGDVGLHKPQPEIFLMGAERVGLTPQQCVFVDDLRENCAGAEAIGMTAVLHRGADSTLPQLERLLGVELG